MLSAWCDCSVCADVLSFGSEVLFSRVMEGRGDSRFNLGYSMNLISTETPPDIYGNPNVSLARPSTSLQQLSPRHTVACTPRGLKSSDVCYDDRGIMSSTGGLGLEACGVSDVSEDTYSPLQAKKSPPSNGKKTKGRVKIKMEYIENKLRRYTTFSKRKTGIMKKVTTTTYHNLYTLTVRHSVRVYPSPPATPPRIARKTAPNRRTTRKITPGP